MLSNTNSHPNQRGIFDYIESNQWCKVQMYAFIHKKDISKHPAVMHYACFHHPSLQVIKSLYNAYPKAISEKDDKGNLPLHTACTRGCSPSVIKFLLKKYPQAALKTEMNDRNTFLLACRSYLWNHKYSQQKWNIANKDLLEVLQILSTALPGSYIIKEDSDEMTPLDYLYETKAIPSVVRFVLHL